MPSIDDWKRALLTLDDEPFFELIKNHLGKVQTPYHKPSIINSIEKFLSSPETRSRILCMMSENEIAVIGFILRSPGPDFDHLYRYFHDTHSALRFQSLTDNLQERFLIYRDESGSFYINPVLQEELEQLVREEPVAVKSFDEPSAEPWFIEELLIAFIAFLQDNPSPCKQSGELKKSVRTAFSEAFPYHDGDTRFMLYLDTLKFLGIVQDQGDRFVVSREQLDSYISLEKTERCTVFIAGIAAAAWHESPPRRAFAAGRTIIESLKKNTTQPLAYERELLVKQLSTELSGENQRFTPRRISHSLDRLIFAGYMDEEEGFVRPLGFKPELEPEHTAPMILQPSFEILFPPEASSSARLFTALYCRIKRFDRISHYELEQQHFTASLRSTGEDANIPQLLARACGDKVPQNVIMTMQGWMERVHQIEIATGTVIKVVPEIIPIIEKEFSSMIVQTLAPGVYFVKPEKLSPFITKWKSLGYADPGEIRNLLTAANNETIFDYAMSIPDVPEILTEPAKNTSRSFAESENASECTRIITELRAHLNSLEVSPEQRRELEAKIQKKLLLFPSQVSPEVCRIGRIEARGIDFHAKLRIIEDVLEHREDLLEIESPELSDGSALVYPLKLTKDPGDPSLTALVLPEEIEQTFKIRRASRIRKRRRSIFY